MIKENIELRKIEIFSMKKVKDQSKFHALLTPQTV